MQQAQLVPPGPAGISGAAASPILQFGGLISSTSYVGLAGGPSVTVTVPASGQALVTIAAQMSATSDGVAESVARMSFESTEGGGPVSASDLRSLAVFVEAPAGAAKIQSSASYVVSGLSPGSHTFIARYRSSGGFLARFDHCSIYAIPLS